MDLKYTPKALMRLFFSNEQPTYKVNLDQNNINDIYASIRQEAQQKTKKWILATYLKDLRNDLDNNTKVALEDLSDQNEQTNKYLTRLNKLTDVINNLDDNERKNIKIQFYLAQLIYILTSGLYPIKPTDQIALFEITVDNNPDNEIDTGANVKDFDIKLNQQATIGSLLGKLTELCDENTQNAINDAVKQDLRYLNINKVLNLQEGEEINEINRAHNSNDNNFDDDNEEHENSNESSKNSENIVVENAQLQKEWKATVDGVNDQNLNSVNINGLCNEICQECILPEEENQYIKTYAKFLIQNDETLFNHNKIKNKTYQDQIKITLTAIKDTVKNGSSMIVADTMKKIRAVNALTKLFSSKLPDNIKNLLTDDQTILSNNEQLQSKIADKQSIAYLETYLFQLIITFLLTNEQRGQDGNFIDFLTTTQIEENTRQWLINLFQSESREIIEALQNVDRKYSSYFYTNLKVEGTKENETELLRDVYFVIIPNNPQPTKDNIQAKEIIKVKIPYDQDIDEFQFLTEQDWNNEKQNYDQNNIETLSNNVTFKKDVDAFVLKCTQPNTEELNIINQKNIILPTFEYEDASDSKTKLAICKNFTQLTKNWETARTKKEKERRLPQQLPKLNVNDIECTNNNFKTIEISNNNLYTIDNNPDHRHEIKYNGQISKRFCIVCELSDKDQDIDIHAYLKNSTNSIPNTQSTQLKNPTIHDQFFKEPELQKSLGLHIISNQCIPTIKHVVKQDPKNNNIWTITYEQKINQNQTIVLNRQKKFKCPVIYNGQLYDVEIKTNNTKPEDCEKCFENLMTKYGQKIFNHNFCSTDSIPFLKDEDYNTLLSYGARFAPSNEQNLHIISVNDTRNNAERQKNNNPEYLDYFYLFKTTKSEATNDKKMTEYTGNANDLSRVNKEFSTRDQKTTKASSARLRVLSTAKKYNATQIGARIPINLFGETVQNKQLNALVRSVDSYKHIITMGALYPDNVNIKQAQYYKYAQKPMIVSHHDAYLAYKLLTEQPNQQETLESYFNRAMQIQQLEDTKKIASKFNNTENSQGFRGKIINKLKEQLKQYVKELELVLKEYKQEKNINDDNTNNNTKELRQLINDLSAKAGNLTLQNANSLLFEIGDDFSQLKADMYASVNTKITNFIQQILKEEFKIAEHYSLLDVFQFPDVSDCFNTHIAKKLNIKPKQNSKIFSSFVNEIKSIIFNQKEFENAGPATIDIEDTNARLQYTLRDPFQGTLLSQKQVFIAVNDNIYSVRTTNDLNPVEQIQKLLGGAEVVEANGKFLYILTQNQLNLLKLNRKFNVSSIDNVLLIDRNSDNNPFKPNVKIDNGKIKVEQFTGYVNDNHYHNKKDEEKLKHTTQGKEFLNKYFAPHPQNIIHIDYIETKNVNNDIKINCCGTYKINFERIHTVASAVPQENNNFLQNIANQFKSYTRPDKQSMELCDKITKKFLYLLNQNSYQWINIFNDAETLKKTLHKIALKECMTLSNMKRTMDENGNPLPPNSNAFDLYVKELMQQIQQQQQTKQPDYFTVQVIENKTLYHYNISKQLLKEYVKLKIANPVLIDNVDEINLGSLMLKYPEGPSRDQAIVNFKQKVQNNYNDFIKFVTKFKDNGVTIEQKTDGNIMAQGIVKNSEDIEPVFDDLNLYINKIRAEETKKKQEIQRRKKEQEKDKKKLDNLNTEKDTTMANCGYLLHCYVMLSLKKYVPNTMPWKKINTLLGLNIQEENVDDIINACHDQDNIFNIFYYFWAYNNSPEELKAFWIDDQVDKNVLVKVMKDHPSISKEATPERLKTACTEMIDEMTPKDNNNNFKANFNPQVDSLNNANNSFSNKTPNVKFNDDNNEKFLKQAVDKELKLSDTETDKTYYIINAANKTGYKVRKYINDDGKLVTQYFILEPQEFFKILINNRSYYNFDENNTLTKIRTDHSKNNFDLGVTIKNCLKNDLEHYNLFMANNNTQQARHQQTRYFLTDKEKELLTINNSNQYIIIDNIIAKMREKHANFIIINNLLFKYNANKKPKLTLAITLTPDEYRNYKDHKANNQIVVANIPNNQNVQGVTANIMSDGQAKEYINNAEENELFIKLNSNSYDAINKKTATDKIHTLRINKIKDLKLKFINGKIIDHSTMEIKDRRLTETYLKEYEQNIEAFKKELAIRKQKKTNNKKAVKLNILQQVTKDVLRDHNEPNNEDPSYNQALTIFKEMTEIDIPNTALYNANLSNILNTKFRNKLPFLQFILSKKDNIAVDMDENTLALYAYSGCMYYATQIVNIESENKNNDWLLYNFTGLLLFLEQQFRETLNKDDKKKQNDQIRKMLFDLYSKINKSNRLMWYYYLREKILCNQYETQQNDKKHISGLTEKQGNDFPHIATLRFLLSDNAGQFNKNTITEILKIFQEQVNSENQGANITRAKNLSIEILKLIIADNIVANNATQNLQKYSNPQTAGTLFNAITQIRTLIHNPSNLTNGINNAAELIVKQILNSQFTHIRIRYHELSNDLKEEYNKRKYQTKKKRIDNDMGKIFNEDNYVDPAFKEHDDELIENIFNSIQPNLNNFNDYINKESIQNKLIEKETKIKKKEMTISRNNQNIKFIMDNEQNSNKYTLTFMLDGQQINISNMPDNIKKIFINLAYMFADTSKHPDDYSEILKKAKLNQVERIIKTYGGRYSLFFLYNALKNKIANVLIDGEVDTNDAKKFSEEDINTMNTLINNYLNNELEYKNIDDIPPGYTAIKFDHTEKNDFNDDLKDVKQYFKYLKPYIEIHTPNTIKCVRLIKEYYLELMKMITKYGLLIDRDRNITAEDIKILLRLSKQKPIENEEEYKTNSEVSCLQKLHYIITHYYEKNKTPTTEITDKLDFKKKIEEKYLTQAKALALFNLRTSDWTLLESHTKDTFNSILKDRNIVGLDNEGDLKIYNARYMICQWFKENFEQLINSNNLPQNTKTEFTKIINEINKNVNKDDYEAVKKQWQELFYNTAKTLFDKLKEIQPHLIINNEASKQNFSKLIYLIILSYNENYHLDTELQSKNIEQINAIFDSAFEIAKKNNIELTQLPEIHNNPNRNQNITTVDVKILNSNNNWGIIKLNNSLVNLFAMITDQDPQERINLLTVVNKIQHMQPQCLNQLNKGALKEFYQNLLTLSQYCNTNKTNRNEDNFDQTNTTIKVIIDYFNNLSDEEISELTKELLTKSKDEEENFVNFTLNISATKTINLTLPSIYAGIISNSNNFELQKKIKFSEEELFEKLKKLSVFENDRTYLPNDSVFCKNKRIEKLYLMAFCLLKITNINTREDDRELLISYLQNPTCFTKDDIDLFIDYFEINKKIDVEKDLPENKINDEQTIQYRGIFYDKNRFIDHFKKTLSSVIQDLHNADKQQSNPSGLIALLRQQFQVTNQEIQGSELCYYLVNLVNNNTINFPAGMDESDYNKTADTLLGNLYDQLQKLTNNDQRIKIPTGYKKLSLTDDTIIDTNAKLQKAEKNIISFYSFLKTKRYDNSMVNDQNPLDQDKIYTAPCLYTEYAQRLFLSSKDKFMSNRHEFKEIRDKQDEITNPPKTKIGNATRSSLTVQIKPLRRGNKYFSKDKLKYYEIPLDIKENEDKMRKMIINDPKMAFAMVTHQDDMLFFIRDYLLADKEMRVYLNMIYQNDDYQIERLQQLLNNLKNNNANSIQNWTIQRKYALKKIIEKMSSIINDMFIDFIDAINIKTDKDATTVLNQILSAPNGHNNNQRAFLNKRNRDIKKLYDSEYKKIMPKIQHDAEIIIKIDDCYFTLKRFEPKLFQLHKPFNDKFTIKPIFNLKQHKGKEIIVFDTSRANNWVADKATINQEAIDDFENRLNREVIASAFQNLNNRNVQANSFTQFLKNKMKKNKHQKMATSAELLGKISQTFDHIKNLPTMNIGREQINENANAVKAIKQLEDTYTIQDYSENVAIDKYGKFQISKTKNQNDNECTTGCCDCPDDQNQDKRIQYIKITGGINEKIKISYEDYQLFKHMRDVPTNENNERDIVRLHYKDKIIYCNLIINADNYELRPITLKNDNNQEKIKYDLALYVDENNNICDITKYAPNVTKSDPISIQGMTKAYISGKVHYIPKYILEIVQKAKTQNKTTFFCYNNKLYSAEVSNNQPPSLTMKEKNYSDERKTGIGNYKNVIHLSVNATPLENNNIINQDKIILSATSFTNLQPFEQQKIAQKIMNPNIKIKTLPDNNSNNITILDTTNLPLDLQEKTQTLYIIKHDAVNKQLIIDRYIYDSTKTAWVNIDTNISSVDVREAPVHFLSQRNNDKYEYHYCHTIDDIKKMIDIEQEERNKPEATKNTIEQCNSLFDQQGPTTIVSKLPDRSDKYRNCNQNIKDTILNFHALLKVYQNKNEFKPILLFYEKKIIDIFNENCSIHKKIHNINDIAVYFDDPSYVSDRNRTQIMDQYGQLNDQLLQLSVYTDIKENRSRDEIINNVINNKNLDVNKHLGKEAGVGEFIQTIHKENNLTSKQSIATYIKENNVFFCQKQMSKFLKQIKTITKKIDNNISNLKSCKITAVEDMKRYIKVIRTNNAELKKLIEKQKKEFDKTDTSLDKENKESKKIIDIVTSRYIKQIAYITQTDNGQDINPQTNITTNKAKDIKNATNAKDLTITTDTLEYEILCALYESKNSLEMEEFRSGDRKAYDKLEYLNQQAEEKKDSLLSENFKKTVDSKLNKLLQNINILFTISPFKEILSREEKQLLMEKIYNAQKLIKNLKADAKSFNNEIMQNLKQIYEILNCTNIKLYIGDIINVFCNSIGKNESEQFQYESLFRNKIELAIEEDPVDTIATLVNLYKQHCMTTSPMVLNKMKDNQAEDLLYKEQQFELSLKGPLLMVYQNETNRQNTSLTAIDIANIISFFQENFDENSDEIKKLYLLSYQNNNQAINEMLRIIQSVVNEQDDAYKKEKIQEVLNKFTIKKFDLNNNILDHYINQKDVSFIFKKNDNTIADYPAQNYNQTYYNNTANEGDVKPIDEKINSKNYSDILIKHKILFYNCNIHVQNYLKALLKFTYSQADVEIEQEFKMKVKILLECLKKGFYPSAQTLAKIVNQNKNLQSEQQIIEQSVQDAMMINLSVKQCHLDYQQNETPRVDEFLIASLYFDQNVKDMVNKHTSICRMHSSIQKIKKLQNEIFNVKNMTINEYWSYVFFLQNSNLIKIPDNPQDDPSQPGLNKNTLDIKKQQLLKDLTFLQYQLKTNNNIKTFYKVSNSIEEIKTFVNNIDTNITNNHSDQNEQLEELIKCTKMIFDQICNMDILNVMSEKYCHLREAQRAMNSLNENTEILVERKNEKNVLKSDDKNSTNNFLITNDILKELLPNDLKNLVKEDTIDKIMKIINATIDHPDYINIHGLLFKTTMAAPGYTLVLSSISENEAIKLNNAQKPQPVLHIRLDDLNYSKVHVSNEQIFIKDIDKNCKKPKNIEDNDYVLDDLEKLLLDDENTIKRFIPAKKIKEFIGDNKNISYIAINNLIYKYNPKQKPIISLLQRTSLESENNITKENTLCLKLKDAKLEKIPNVTNDIINTIKQNNKNKEYIQVFNSTAANNKIRLTEDEGAKQSDYKFYDGLIYFKDTPILFPKIKNLEAFLIKNKITYPDYINARVSLVNRVVTQMFSSTTKKIEDQITHILEQPIKIDQNKYQEFSDKIILQKSVNGNIVTQEECCNQLLGYTIQTKKNTTNPNQKIDPTIRPIRTLIDEKESKIENFNDNRLNTIFFNLKESDMAMVDRRKRVFKIKNFLPNEQKQEFENNFYQRDLSNWMYLRQEQSNALHTQLMIYDKKQRKKLDNLNNINIINTNYVQEIKKQKEKLTDELKQLGAQKVATEIVEMIANPDDINAILGIIENRKSEMPNNLKDNQFQDVLINEFRKDTNYNNMAGNINVINIVNQAFDTICKKEKQIKQLKEKMNNLNQKMSLSQLVEILISIYEDVSPIKSAIEIIKQDQQCPSWINKLLSESKDNNIEQTLKQAIIKIKPIKQNIMEFFNSNQFSMTDFVMLLNITFATLKLKKNNNGVGKFFNLTTDANNKISISTYDNFEDFISKIAQNDQDTWEKYENICTQLDIISNKETIQTKQKLLDELKNKLKPENNNQNNNQQLLENKKQTDSLIARLQVMKNNVTQIEAVKQLIEQPQHEQTELIETLLKYVPNEPLMSIKLDENGQFLIDNEDPVADQHRIKFSDTIKRFYGQTIADALEQQNPNIMNHLYCLLNNDQIDDIENRKFAQFILKKENQKQKKLKMLFVTPTGDNQSEQLLNIIIDDAQGSLSEKRKFFEHFQNIIDKNFSIQILPDILKIVQVINQLENILTEDNFKKINEKYQNNQNGKNEFLNELYGILADCAPKNVLEANQLKKLSVNNNGITTGEEVIEAAEAINQGKAEAIQQTIMELSQNNNLFPQDLLTDIIVKSDLTNDQLVIIKNNPKPLKQLDSFIENLNNQREEIMLAQIDQDNLDNADFNKLHLKPADINSSVKFSNLLNNYCDNEVVEHVRRNYNNIYQHLRINSPSIMNINKIFSEISYIALLEKANNKVNKNQIKTFKINKNPQQNICINVLINNKKNKYRIAFFEKFTKILNKVDTGDVWNWQHIYNLIAAINKNTNLTDKDFKVFENVLNGADITDNNDINAFNLKLNNFLVEHRMVSSNSLIHQISLGENNKLKFNRWTQKGLDKITKEVEEDKKQEIINYLIELIDQSLDNPSFEQHTKQAIIIDLKKCKLNELEGMKVDPQNNSLLAKILATHGFRLKNNSNVPVERKINELFNLCKKNLAKIPNAQTAINNIDDRLKIFTEDNINNLNIPQQQQETIKKILMSDKKITLINKYITYTEKQNLKALTLVINHLIKEINNELEKENPNVNAQDQVQPIKYIILKRSNMGTVTCSTFDTYNDCLYEFAEDTDNRNFMGLQTYDLIAQNREQNISNMIDKIINENLVVGMPDDEQKIKCIELLKNLFNSLELSEQELQELTKVIEENSKEQNLESGQVKEHSQYFIQNKIKQWLISKKPSHEQNILKTFNQREMCKPIYIAEIIEKAKQVITNNPTLKKSITQTIINNRNATDRNHDALLILELLIDLPQQNSRRNINQKKAPVMNSKIIFEEYNMAANTINALFDGQTENLQKEIMMLANYAYARYQTSNAQPNQLPNAPVNCIDIFASAANTAKINDFGTMKKKFLDTIKPFEKRQTQKLLDKRISNDNKEALDQKIDSLFDAEKNNINNHPDRLAGLQYLEAINIGGQ